MGSLEIIKVENGWAVFKNEPATDKYYNRPIYVAETLAALLEIIKEHYTRK
jgi:hypothetical protein